jgi:hypothetical protein
MVDVAENGNKTSASGGVAPKLAAYSAWGGGVGAGAVLLLLHPMRLMAKAQSAPQRRLRVIIVLNSFFREF